MSGREGVMDEDGVRRIVREGYAGAARKGAPCRCRRAPGAGRAADALGRRIGYSAEDLEAVPEGANLGLGCGNPIAHASLVEGETVLDLGSGAGFDCFLAARRVGARGRVIGVDMTPEMVEKARENARAWGATNVEFRLGEIEDLPVEDASVDVVISNCVVNISPDKARVFREAFRVLKEGGRLMVSDLVLKRGLPEKIRESAAVRAGCISGALLKSAYLETIAAAGFGGIEVIEERAFPVADIVNDVTAKAMAEAYGDDRERMREVEACVSSIKVKAVKGRGAAPPAGGGGR